MRGRRGARPRSASFDPAQALRRVWHALATVLLVAVIGGVGTGVWVFAQQLLSPEVHPVESVEVKGTIRHVRERDLFMALAPLLQQGYWGVRVHQAQSAIEALEWVESALVRRSWPGRLIVSVREHEALARWSDDGLVTVDGLIFRPPAETWPQGLALLEGNAAQATLLVERYLDWRELLEELGDAPLHIQVDQRQSWRVLLNSGAMVELGRSDVEQRMRRFVDTAGLVLRATDARIMTADLRYPNGLAIRWHGDDGN